MPPFTLPAGQSVFPGNDFASELDPVTRKALDALISQIRGNLVRSRPSVTPHALARYDDATGQVIRDSIVVAEDDGRVTVTNPRLHGVMMIGAYDTTYGDVLFNMYVDDTGRYIPMNAASGYVSMGQFDNISMSMEIVYGQTPGQVITFLDKRIGVAVVAPGSTERAGGNVYTVGGLGTGAIAGPTFKVGPNTSGNGAAGTLDLVDRNNGENFIWFDATGVPRYGTAPPTENNSVSDTSGTPFGTGSGTVTTTGSPTTGLLPMFSGATSITNADAAAVTAALDLLGT